MSGKGKIELPDDVHHRYGLQRHTAVRGIESGLVLIPLTDEPMRDSQVVISLRNVRPSGTNAQIGEWRPQDAPPQALQRRVYPSRGS